MKDLPPKLYRALRREEISAVYILIPKAKRPFVADPRLPNVLPWDLGTHIPHAVREHQWDKPGFRYETSGISTTPHLCRARYYAEYCDPMRHIAATKIVVTIDTTAFGRLDIYAHQVVDCVNTLHISVSEDDEIILEYRGGHEFPKEIIVGVTKL